MFDLDIAIAEWRRQMQAAGLKTPVPLDELESHLRDDIETQMRSGADTQQAFEAAVRRIGQAGRLRTEFEKAGETRRARERKLMCAVIVGFACFYSLFVGACILFKLGSFSGVNLKQQMSAAAATVLTVILMVSGCFAHRFLPPVPHRRTRMGIYAAGGALLLIWLSVFYHLIMTRFELGLDQLVVAILWAWVPMGVFCGVIQGLEEAARRKSAMTEHDTNDAVPSV